MPLQTDFSEPLENLIDARESEAARVLLRSFGVNIFKTYQFWEAMVARLTSGEMTDHKCGWDIDLEWRRIEVKFATESMCRFRTGPRPIFKFSLPKGLNRVKDAHVIVLLGFDSKQRVHSWVLPAAVIKQVRSITLTHPSYKNGMAKRSFQMDEFNCPPMQILPEVLRAAHIKDLHHHAQTAYATRMARRGNLELPL